MTVKEEIKKVRGELESKKPILALPPSPLEIVEITDTKSPAFKKAMEIYTKSLPEEEREEEANIARYVRRTQKTGKESPLGNSEFHLLAIKDTSIQGNETEKIIGQAQISYFPGKRIASKDGYVFKDIEFDIPPVRKGGRPQRANFCFDSLRRCGPASVGYERHYRRLYENRVQSEECGA
ncbi:MAG: hypothetical protein HY051_02700 [Candidatus Aenigmarchaeota archaeon]|nr:hypothetical protein [Candidatus Aenigmarchaeota archaeon]